jgi:hypothetical protein
MCSQVNPIQVVLLVYRWLRDSSTKIFTLITSLSYSGKKTFYQVSLAYGEEGVVAASGLAASRATQR